MIFAFAAPSRSQIPAADSLALNQSKEFEIKGGETQAFSVTLSPNQTARVEIEQLGIDVSLAASNPVGEKFIETESPSGLYGSDLILVTAVSAGNYTIHVTPANPRSPSGKYRIWLSQIRPTIEEDFRINNAARKITKLAEETSIARAKGTIAGRREALAKWSEIVALSKTKKDRVWEGIALLSSGLIYEQLGELQNALDVYIESLEIWQEIGNRQYEGSAVNNLGIIHNDLGEYDKAIANYNRAIEIQTEIGNRQSVGIYLNNLAYAQMRLGNHERADEFFRQSLAIKQDDETNRGQRSVAVTLNNIGTNLSLKGDQTGGLDFLSRALELRRKIGDKWGIANSLLNLGKALDAADKVPESRKNADEANIRAVELGDRRMEAESLYLLAVAEKRAGNFDKALLNVARGLELVETIRGELIGSEVRYAYFSTVQNYYELYIDLLVGGYEETGDKALAVKAFEISERSRSRTLIDLLRQANVTLRKGIDPVLLEKLQTSQNLLNDKYNQRLRLLSETPTAEQVGAINIEIARLIEESEAVRTNLREKHPKFAGLTEGKTMTAAELQTYLDDDTVLLEYKLAEKRSFMWLVSKTSVDVFVLPARPAIEEKASEFYGLVSVDDPSKATNAARISEELSRILLAPVAAGINGKRIIVVADGALQHLPFSALPLPGDTRKVLAAQNEVVLLPSGSVLAEIRADSIAPASPEKTIAVFADPVFDEKDVRIKRERNQKPLSSKDPSSNKTKLPRLLASREEAQNIAGFVNKSGADLFTDFEASFNNVAQRKFSDYRIVHFATHGILDTAKPSNSGLMFSLFDEKGKPQKGFLSLDGIYNLEIPGEMVVLSACQTALGKDVRGEGLIGLSRGFLYAGSSRVVASLWKVDDSATAEFMKRFYRIHLKENLPAAAALRRAKLEMMQIPRYKSPFYWSAFTLLGDWK